MRRHARRASLDVVLRRGVRMKRLPTEVKPPIHVPTSARHRPSHGANARPLEINPHAEALAPPDAPVAREPERNDRW
jgi:hypothetical protein